MTALPPSKPARRSAPSSSSEAVKTRLPHLLPWAGKGLYGLRSRPSRSTVAVAGLRRGRMKEGYRFVDCDMHIMEPPELFEKYLDPEFKPRVTSSLRRMEGGATGMRGRPTWYFGGEPLSNDGNVAQNNRIRGPPVGARGNKKAMLAVGSGHDSEGQVGGRAMEGVC